MKPQHIDEDVLIIGAGPVGCVLARELSEKGMSCHVMEKRNHVAGNCYDEVDPFGLLIHKYGPHYFRTNDPQLIQYLSRFTDWIPGNYLVKSSFRGSLYPFPINITTLELFFKKNLTPELAKKLLEEKSIPNAQPLNSEEFVLSRVGSELYRAFYYGYTLKQWERKPKELDASVCGRIPIRFSREERYVDHTYQLLPERGFTELFKKMLDHPKIRVSLKTDYFNSKPRLKGKKLTIYCGAVDQYFDYQRGRLPWRSLEFEFKNYKKEFHQPCVQINYPDPKTPYTRTVEIKHATGQVHPSTTVCYEYPRSKGDPYYPVPSSEARTTHSEYLNLVQAEKKKNVYFVGRLANYLYLNTDQAIELALKTAQEILNDQTRISNR